MGGFDFSDVFSDLFQGGGTRQRRGRDISIDLEISFKESVFGTTRRVLLAKTAQCETCQGSGAEPGTKLETCDKCNGAGKIHETNNSFFGAISMTRVCPQCHGIGKVPKEKCHTCRGEGVYKKQEEIEIVVPAGIEGGEMIRLTRLRRGGRGRRFRRLVCKSARQPRPALQERGRAYHDRPFGKAFRRASGRRIQDPDARWGRGAFYSTRHHARRDYFSKEAAA